MSWRRAFPAMAAAVAAVPLGRAMLWQAPAHPVLMVLDLLVPTIALAALLLAVGWSGPGAWGIPVSPRGTAGPVRLALGCGLAGFVVHNLVTYSLYLSGPATVFYVAAGACLAQAGGGRTREVRAARWLLAAAAGAFTLAVLGLLWLPVQRKTSRTADMLEALETRDLSAAWQDAVRAAEADGLDPRPAADAAQVSLMMAGVPQVPVGRAMGLAMTMADQAVRRDEQSSLYHQLAGNVAWAAETMRNPRLVQLVAEGDKAFAAGHEAEALTAWTQAQRLVQTMYSSEKAVAELGRAVELDPMDSRLRIACAAVLCNTARPRRCLMQLDEADRLDALLPADSFQRLKPPERRQLDALRARATWLVEHPATAPAPSTAPAPAPTTAPAASRPTTRGATMSRLAPTTVPLTHP